ARVLRGPALGQHRRAGPRRGLQALPQLPHFGTHRPREDDAERIEEHELRMAPHRLRHVLEPRSCDEPSQPFDFPPHVTPSALAAPSETTRHVHLESRRPEPISYTGTCATF